MRFEMVIDSDPYEKSEDAKVQWEAAVFEMDDNDRSSDLLARGTGRTIREAVTNALANWPVPYDHDHDNQKD